jgi:hypothetical protein
MTRTRGLSVPFFDALRIGPFANIADVLRRDPTLELGIRDDYINIYYRGGSLLRVARGPDGSYLAFFDAKYGTPTVALPTPTNPAAWVPVFPALKQTMDDWFHRHSKAEREIQQQIVRENNRGKVARATDYFVCDIEYANGDRRFDMVAVRWPSTSGDRKRGDGLDLVLVEVKHGDAALNGTAGMAKHVRDACAFVAGAGALATLKQEMALVFNQKRALKLIDCDKDIASFSSAKPTLLFILANHDPASEVLLREIRGLPPHPEVDLRFVTSCFMGYGLFDEGIHAKDEFLEVNASRLRVPRG